MKLTELQQEIYEVMEDKGLHDTDYSQQDAWAFRQMAHLFVEWTEVISAQESEDVIEELADIIIVACDLAEGVGHTIDAENRNIYEWNLNDLGVAIGQLNNDWRKRKDPSKLDNVVSLAMTQLDAMYAKPLQEVAAKMEKNKARAQKYGVAS